MNEPPMHPTTFRGKGGWWVISQSLLLCAIVFAGPLDRAPIPDWSFAGGLTLFALGGAIGIAGVIRLDRNRTPYPLPRADSQLITTGIYAWLRHPLYTCLVIASLGWAGIFFSCTALALTPILAILLYAKSRREERHLLAAFPHYKEYRKRVAGFVPGVF